MIQQQKIDSTINATQVVHDQIKLKNNHKNPLLIIKIKSKTYFEEQSTILYCTLNYNITTLYDNAKLYNDNLNEQQSYQCG